MKRLKRNENRKISFEITSFDRLEFTDILATNSFYVKTANQSIKKIILISKLKDTFAKIYPEKIISLKLEIEPDKYN